jgi:GNAT superfamily N-acetyltransferase
VTVLVEAPAIRELVDSDEAAVLTLLQSALAGGPTGERSGAFLRWKHVDNPFGRSVGLVAEQAGGIIGVRLVMQWGFEAGGQAISAGRMVDTATHPAHQGRGIFRALTTASLEIAREDTDVIFNTPNASSRPGYLKMGWQQVGVLATSIAPVRPHRLAMGARAALRRTDDSRPVEAQVDSPLPLVRDVLETHGCDIEALLAARTDCARGRLTTRVDLAFLRWRYVDVPGLDYRAVPVTRGDRLVGLGIGRMRSRSSLREFTLAEVLTANGDVQTAATVLRHARHAGADHVATHQPRNSPAAKALPRAGYLTTKRVGLTLTTLPLRKLPIDPLAADSWSLALGDIEVF